MHEYGMSCALDFDRRNQNLKPAEQPIEGTGACRDKRLSLQDPTQSVDNVGYVAAAFDRRIAFRDIIPTRLLGREAAGLRGFFPFSVAAQDRPGAVDNLRKCLNLTSGRSF